MPICYILGMHRSGTSFVASYLHENGVSFSLRTFREVPVKHHEYNDINDMNDSILGSWKDPVFDPMFVRRWLYERRVRRLIRRVTSDGRLVGIKDPRLPLVFEPWAKASPGFRAIGVFRRPLESAKSLAVRTDAYGHADLDKALALWRLTNERLISLVRQYEFPLLDFNASREELSRQLSLACRYLGIAFSPGRFSEMFKEGERHHKQVEIPDEMKSVYGELQQLSRESLQRLDAMKGVGE